MDRWSEIGKTLNALGIGYTGVVNGVFMLESETDRTVADAVVAAHDKPLTSSERRALKQLLGASSPEWQTYKEARNKPIKEKRKQRYRDETDGMRMDADYDHTIGSTPWNNAIDAWKAARTAIKNELPYLEDNGK